MLEYYSPIVEKVSRETQFEDPRGSPDAIRENVVVGMMLIAVRLL
jgi:hypothetical protein